MYLQKHSVTLIDRLIALQAPDLVRFKLQLTQVIVEHSPRFAKLLASLVKEVEARCQQVQLQFVPFDQLIDFANHLGKWL